MPSVNDARSKLEKAIAVLTTHEGDIRQRLASAWHKLLPIPPTSLPEKARDEFVWCMTTIQKGAGTSFGEHEGTPHSLPNIPVETAVSVARKLLEIKNRLDDAAED